MDPLLADRALLDRFRRGERDALAGVYHATVDRVFDLVRHGFLLDGGGRVAGVADPAAQRDVIHDVFVKAFAERARLAYDGLRPFLPYLLRIARNVLVDRLRRQGVEASAGEAGLEAAALETESPATGDGEGVDDLHWRTLREATRVCLGGMDAERRRFVQLRFEEDQAQREVAEQMGVTRRRVRTLEERVLGELRTFLSGKGLL